MLEQSAWRERSDDLDRLKVTERADGSHDEAGPLICPGLWEQGLSERAP
jgi:hypothetical protein